MDFLLLFLTAGSALANAGPHGGYVALEDKCATCHRAHTASGSRLITEAGAYQLCSCCHGSGGTGSYLDVDDGVYILTGARLNGGGFQYITGTVVTSRHDVLGMVGYSPQYAWGGGTTGPGLGGSNTTNLECTSCHNPHGSENYRVLRENWFWADGEFPTRAVTTTETVPNYAAGNSGAYSAGISLWCVTCHTQYTHRGGTYDAGDGLGLTTRYRHSVSGFIPAGSTLLEMRTGVNENFSCLTCHFAHGTTATVGPHSKNILPTNDSALLYIEKSGACVSCHLPNSPDNIEITSCLKCHNADGLPAISGGDKPPDIEGRLLLSNSHPVACTSCHATMPNHRDGTVQKYADGGFTMTKPLTVPITTDTEPFQYSSSYFELCFSCHDERNVMGLPSGYNQYNDANNPLGYPLTNWKIATRFINVSTSGNYSMPTGDYPPPVNIHWDHLEDYNKWHDASGYLLWYPNSASGTVQSKFSCITCHDPHGSSRPAMTRADLLITNGPAEGDSVGWYRYIGSNEYRNLGGDLYCAACHWSGDLPGNEGASECLAYCHDAAPQTQGTRWYYKLKP